MTTQDSQGKVGGTGAVNAGGGNASPAAADYSREAIMARLQEKQRQEAPKPIRIPAWVTVLLVAVVLFTGWRWYRGLGVSDIPLCVVNTSSNAPFEIRLDGKSIGRVPRMVGEDPKAALVTPISVGAHEVEARDAAGSVVGREKFTVEKGSHGFLWTPSPDPTFYFLLQTTEYGGAAGRAGEVRLEGDAPLKPFPAMVTQWFHDNPSAVSVRKGTKTDFERALRRANPE